MVLLRRLAMVLIAAVALAACETAPVKEISRIFERKGEPPASAAMGADTP